MIANPEYSRFFDKQLLISDIFPMSRHEWPSANKHCTSNSDTKPSFHCLTYLRSLDVLLEVPLRAQRLKVTLPALVRVQRLRRLGLRRQNLEPTGQFHPQHVRLIVRIGGQRQTPAGSPIGQITVVQ